MATDPAVRLSEAQRNLLFDANDDAGYAYCGYSKEVRAVAASLEDRGLGTVGENDCGPVFRINTAGRAALTQGRGTKP
jgi:hypothetical protein